MQNYMEPSLEALPTGFDCFAKFLGGELVQWVKLILHGRLLLRDEDQAVPFLRLAIFLHKQYEDKNNDLYQNNLSFSIHHFDGWSLNSFRPIGKSRSNAACSDPDSARYVSAEVCRQARACHRRQWRHI